MIFIPSLTFTELWVVSMEHMQRVWLASRERLPFRTPGSVPHFGLANAPIVETKFLELAMSLLDFSPRILLGTFSIFLQHNKIRNIKTIWLWKDKDLFKICNEKGKCCNTFCTSLYMTLMSALDSYWIRHCCWWNWARPPRPVLSWSTILIGLFCIVFVNQSHV